MRRSDDTPNSDALGTKCVGRGALIPFARIEWAACGRNGRLLHQANQPYDIDLRNPSHIR
jgi:hypothetical protein